MKLICRIVLIGIMCLAELAAVGADQPAPRPNFIVVLVDDLGYGDFGCYGNVDVKTPHIDRLAAEGRRFTQFYSNSPVCSPSRTAWTTGQYPARWKITSYLAERQETRKGQEKGQEKGTRILLTYGLGNFLFPIAFLRDCVFAIRQMTLLSNGRVSKFAPER